VAQLDLRLDIQYLRLVPPVSAVWEHPCMKPMTADEQAEHAQVCLAIRSALSTLRLTRCKDEDVRVAAARLEEWLANNDGRWVK
jgi:hypothetical protein